jgi:hypothetical protein
MTIVVVPRKASLEAPLETSGSLDDEIPDVRDGLTRKERVVLWTLSRLQRARGGRSVPLVQLYGHVVEHVDMSIDELQRIVERMVSRPSS